MMENYIDVAERIRQFRAAFPNGCLRPANPSEPFKIQEIGGREFIIYVAAAYRTPDDPMPAIAVAAEPAVGKTNFTRDSEVMNAETSAWGRAIVAALAADTQKIASLEEVRNRQVDESSPTVSVPKLRPVPSPDHPSNHNSQRPVASISTGDLITDKQKGMLSKVAREKGLTGDDLIHLVEAVTEKKIASITELSKKDASAVIKYLMELVV